MINQVEPRSHIHYVILQIYTLDGFYVNFYNLDKSEKIRDLITTG